MSRIVNPLDSPRRPLGVLCGCTGGYTGGYAGGRAGGYAGYGDCCESG